MDSTEIILLSIIVLLGAIIILQFTIFRKLQKKNQNEENVEDAYLRLEDTLIEIDDMKNGTDEKEKIPEDKTNQEITVSDAVISHEQSLIEKKIRKKIEKKEKPLKKKVPDKKSSGKMKNVKKKRTTNKG